MTLFDIPSEPIILSPWQQQQADRPFQPHSVPSFNAAEEIAQSANDLRATVFDYIVAHQPCTDQQIQDGTGIAESTERPRRRELQQRGLIRLDGGKALTRSGRSAGTWVVA